MGLEFLARIRQSSLWATLLAALFVSVYRSYMEGLGLAAGSIWCLGNLWLLERIVTGLTGPTAAPRRALLAGLTNLAWFGVGAAALVALPTAALLVGFTLPFGVILLKACSRALLESAFWRRLTRSPWQSVALVALLGLGAWLAIGPLARAIAQPGGEPPAQATTAAPHAEAPATGEHAPSGEAHAGSEGSELKEFDNVLSILVRANPDKGWAHTIHQFETVIFSLFVALVLCAIAIAATRRPAMIPGRLQNVVEAAVETVYTQVVDILGPKYGPRYVPFLGSLFIYVFAMNLFGIVPLMKAPTSNLNVTLALALTVFVYVQFTAFKELGVLGWLDHMAGSPRTPIEWGLVPLALPIHIMGELAKPVSLSCRLFGNIFGEDMLLVGFASLGIGLMSALHLGGLPFGLPIHFIFLFLALLTSFVQALVFSMLSTIYFLLMLPHDHDHGHGHEAEAHHAH